MVTDQKYSSNSTDIEQKVIRRTKKIAKLLGPEQNAKYIMRISVKI
jgi:hypothetical protein